MDATRPDLVRQSAALSWCLSREFGTHIRVSTVTVDGSAYMTAIRIGDDARDSLLLYDTEAPTLSVLSLAVADYQTTN